MLVKTISGRVCEGDSGRDELREGAHPHNVGGSTPSPGGHRPSRGRGCIPACSCAGTPSSSGPQTQTPGSRLPSPGPGLTPLPSGSRPAHPR